MKRNLIFPAMLLLVFTVSSCKKKDPENPPVVIAAKSFEKIEFSRINAFFSTDGNSTTPMDSVAAMKVAETIDFTFIYDTDYNKHGLMDPVTRSKVFYWDNYVSPWLSVAKETRLYDTNLKRADFDAAKRDQSKISAYFNDTTKVTLAPHGIFPLGTCIGGRDTDDPQSIYFRPDHVYGFKVLSTGKMGLVYVPVTQPNGWLNFNSNTFMDIIRQN